MANHPNPVFMKRAIDLATENVRSAVGGPFAALIVKDGVLVAEAANTVTATNDPAAHGEINAIRKACAALNTFSLKGCEMYTSSEPCPMCLAASYWAHLEVVYFGNDCEAAARAGFGDAFLYHEFKLDREARTLPAKQLMQDEAWESFQVWQETPNKVE